jgi:ribonuclease HI
MTDLPEVTIYTDGACLGNPGPGGYAAILISAGKRKVVTGGRRLTTNNRMEILAAVAALEALKQPCRVLLHSDSRYLVDTIVQGHAQRWRANGWRRNRKEYALNVDLWEQLLRLCEKHTVKFTWVQGHAGHVENEECDLLSAEAARAQDLPPDAGYQEAQARIAAQPKLFDF